MFIVRQRDVGDVRLTRALRGSTCWSAHCLIRSKLSLRLASRRRHTIKAVKKLNVRRLCQPAIQDSFQDQLDKELSKIPEAANAAAEWSHMRKATYQAAVETVGYRKRIHRDWFDESDTEASTMLDDLHNNHLAWIKDKSSYAKKQLYTQCSQQVQTKLRQMKNTWWENLAQDLQTAADTHDMKSFYDNLKKAYGPRDVHSAPVRSKDETTLLTNQSDTLQRWAEHLNSVLNQPSTFDHTVLQEIPQWPISENLADPPSLSEVHRAIRLLSNGKAPGADCFPAELFKHGGMRLIHRLVYLFSLIWREEEVPQDITDASIMCTSGKVTTPAAITIEASHSCQ